LHINLLSNCTVLVALVACGTTAINWADTRLLLLLLLLRAVVAGDVQA
jgi:hypothetical protein